MKFKAHIANKETHKIVAAITFNADGYLTALNESHKLCKQNYENCYVATLEKNND